MTTTAPDPRDVIASVLGLRPVDLDNDAGPATLAEWTSLKHVELVMTLEEVYGVTMTHQEISRMTSVAAVRSWLAQRGVAA